MGLFDRLFKTTKINNVLNGVKIGGDFVGGNSSSNISDLNMDVDTGATITLNGVSYSGKNITITNGNIQIDGKPVNDKGLRALNISVEGNVKTLTFSTCNRCTINGSVVNVKSSSGDIEIAGNCEGDVTTSSGDVTIGGHMNGDATTSSGDINSYGK